MADEKLHHFELLFLNFLAAQECYNNTTVFYIIIIPVLTRTGRVSDIGGLTKVLLCAVVFSKAPI
jgi:hypothetical protein